MRGSLQRYFHRIWYEGAKPPLVFRGLAHLYAALVRFDRWRFESGRTRRFRSAMPVVVVGNMTAGGTGKTPLVDWIVGRGRALGLRVGIVSRGHGRKSGGMVRATSMSTAADIGDEPLLLYRRHVCPLVVSADRAEALRALESDVDIVVLDDGLQHHAIEQDFRIAVTDAQRGSGNGRMLPAGPLREPLSRLSSVDLVVVNGDPDSMLMEGDTLVSLRDPERTMKLSALGDKDAVIAIAGIGNPQRFFKSLPIRSEALRTVAFADHHAYQPADLEPFRNACVVMTEKDAVKIRFTPGDDWWYLPIRAQLTPSVATKIDDALCRLTVK